ncbi:hypothetical protein BJY01DRAFT_245368 [Aspergillus pseudoustus]|uniref:Uncharacterized protein n=1 Tax=Aspergillus pseudoustus TaxID=1810923 RepID=A0ABR4KEH3_9EURO
MGKPQKEQDIRALPTGRCQAAAENLDGRNSPCMFNIFGYISDTTATPTTEPYGFSVSKGSLVPDEAVVEGAVSILERASAPIKKRLIEHFETGFDELLWFDHYSTREYLKCEFSSGLYSQSLSEAVLDAMDFNYPLSPRKKMEWYTIKGGTSQIVRWIEDTKSPCRGKHITGIQYNPAKRQHPVSVIIGGETHPREYTAVFNTASLPCTRLMQLSAKVLSPSQNAAIQTVHYDSGGQASTHLPLRACVYPSSEAANTSTVLICSYTWGQGAQQMASLTSPNGESELKRLIFHSLAHLHQECRSTNGAKHGYTAMLNLIQAKYEAIQHLYSNPDTSGAFAPASGWPCISARDYIGAVLNKQLHEIFMPFRSRKMQWRALDSACRELRFVYKLHLQGRVPEGTLEDVRKAVGQVKEIESEVLEWQVILAEVSRVLRVESMEE